MSFLNSGYFGCNNSFVTDVDDELQLLQGNSCSPKNARFWEEEPHGHLVGRLQAHLLKAHEDLLVAMRNAAHASGAKETKRP